MKNLSFKNLVKEVASTILPGGRPTTQEGKIGKYYERSIFPAERMAGGLRGVATGRDEHGNQPDQLRLGAGSFGLTLLRAYGSQAKAGRAENATRRYQAMQRNKGQGY